MLIYLRGVEGVTCLRYSKKCESRISYPAKLLFKYKGHKPYQHKRAQWVSFPWILTKNFISENASEKQNTKRDIDIKTSGSTNYF